MPSTPGLGAYLEWYTEWTFMSNVVGDLSSLDMFDQYLLAVTPKVQEAALRWTEKEREEGLAPSLEEIHTAMVSKLTKVDTLFHLKTQQNARRSRSAPQVARVAAVSTEDKRKDTRVYIPRSERECTHCKKKGHTADVCFDKHPDLLKKYKSQQTRARSKSKERSPSGEARPFKPYKGYTGCLECKSMDHMVRNCPKNK